MIRSKRAGLVALVASMALVAACGGGEDPTAGPSDTATATPTATVAPLRVASPDTLTSYRYEVSVNILPEALDQANAPAGLNLAGLEFSIRVTGEVVNPDREHTVTAADLGFAKLQTETVTIGADEWNLEPNGTWSTGSASGSGLFGETSFTPGSVFPASSEFSFADLSARLEALPSEAEQVNGVSTRHYALTQEQFDQLFATDEPIIPPGVEDAKVAADIWFDLESGVPVRMLVLATKSDGTELMRLELNISDLNSAGISIEPPV